MKVDRARIGECEAEIAAIESRIVDMERGRLRHYCEDANGRLLADDTPRMLRVARASRDMKMKILALLQNRAA